MQALPQLIAYPLMPPDFVPLSGAAQHLLLVEDSI